MINKLDIYGYKSLLDISVKLGSLNVLAGVNASGKSSVIQAILLIMQSMASDGLKSGLHLSGPLLEAGTASDVLHPSSNYKLMISLDEDGITHDFTFTSSDDDDRSKRRAIPIYGDGSVSPSLSGNLKNITYLQAERIGPRVIYSIPPDGETLGGIVGTDGKYTSAALDRAQEQVQCFPGWSAEICSVFANAAEKFDQIDLNDELTNSEGRIDLLANLMLNWIMPGAEFSTIRHDDIDAAVLRFSRDPEGTRALVRPTHIGFGLIYALHVIAAGLFTKPGDIYMVENPEAHLHPFSQSRIGAFLALLSSTGRQVIIETHSDHVVNGIRLAVRFGVSQANDVFFSSFERDLETSTTSVTSIQINELGRLDRWPRGFFSQIERDLARL